MIKLFKCREDLFEGTVEGIEDPGNNFWYMSNNLIKKVVHEPYDRYIFKSEPDSYNLIPTKALVYINIDDTSYGRLLRHNLTTNIQPKSKVGNLIMFDVRNQVSIDMDHWKSQPNEKWLKLGNRGDKIILQLHLIKVLPMDTSCDDVLGELYYYSADKIVINIKR
eukprot:TRINITY_DN7113_c0_g1_i1.p1 TRINITY_DN7113_c0_g1~~TRINITY_DN7113_c0_g1_i1.p1  ORF type:complete len:165 (-),score=16.90 TRINITY_DN7113_c0_g1_i1:928-1422(-)